MAVHLEEVFSMGCCELAAWCKQAFPMTQVPMCTGVPGGSGRDRLLSLLV